MPNEPEMPSLTVWDFTPGMIFRINRTFKDCYGQELQEGEVLHFLERDYLPYHGGHTLKFAEKTIYLSDNYESDLPIIDNSGNEYFCPLSFPPAGPALSPE
jgi:hypothetical protein